MGAPIPIGALFDMPIWYDMQMEAIVDVRELRKRYGGTEAVKGVSFSVAKGEVFGILGPNGAGKTTTLEMVEALRPIDGGTARIASSAMGPCCFTRL